MKRGPTKTRNEEPSEASLREIAPLDPKTTVTLGRGAEGLAMARGLTAALRRGRPKRGEVAVGTTARSVRLSTSEWAALELLATERGIAPNAAMREAIVQWIAQSELKRADKPRRAKRAAP